MTDRLEPAVVADATDCPPCPVCDAPGRLDRPDLGLLGATCTSCGWHYTPHERRHVEVDERIAPGAACMACGHGHATPAAAAIDIGVPVLRSRIVLCRPCIALLAQKCRAVLACFVMVVLVACGSNVTVDDLPDPGTSTGEVVSTTTTTGDSTDDGRTATSSGYGTTGNLSTGGSTTGPRFDVGQIPDAPAPGQCPVGTAPVPLGVGDDLPDDGIPYTCDLMCEMGGYDGCVGGQTVPGAPAFECDDILEDVFDETGFDEVYCMCCI